MATNQPPIAQTDPIHLGKLSTSVYNQYEQALFFTNFQADVIRNKKGEMVSPAAPITRRRDLEGPAGQDNLTIPAMKNLVGDPFYGQAIVTGKGEKQRHDLIKVYINDVIFPLEGPGAMDVQRAKVLQYLTRHRRQMAVRLAQEDEIQCVSAIYEGRSRNVTATAANGGLAKAKLYHPNFYSASSGKATWSGTVATHANNIGAKAAELSDISAHHFGVDLLERARVWVQEENLDPIVINGKPHYCMLLHSNQMSQLRRDTKWKEPAQHADVRGDGNRLFAMAETKYANFLMYERLLSVFGLSWTEAAGVYTLTFGATSPIVARDTNPVKCAIIFGNGALSKGIVGGPRFGEQDQNIQGYKEFALRMMMGYARNTMYDTDPDSTTATTEVEQGSIIVASYSPTVI
jgi:hypothetical protein